MDKSPRDPRQRETAGARESHQHALVAAVEPAPLRLFRSVLTDLGFEIEVVDSGIGAVMAARERCPDLILVDMQLRDVPGREAVEWLRSNPALKSTPVIILAATGEDKADAPSIPPDMLLRRPVSPVAIRRAIGNVLDKAP
jgi:two-component system, cell cycle response regulator